MVGLGVPCLGREGLLVRWDWSLGSCEVVGGGWIEGLLGFEGHVRRNIGYVCGRPFVVGGWSRGET